MQTINYCHGIMKRHKQAITLVELLIAMTLMGVIILGAVAFDVASRRFLASSEQDTALLNEMSLILDHMNRNIAQATGDATNPGITWDPATGTLRIRIDEANALADYTQHTWVQYVFSGNQVTFQGQPLTQRLDAIPTITTCCDAPGCPPVSPAFNCLASPAEGGVRMSGLRLRHDNHVVSIEDATNPPSDTVYFFPFSHSWN